jgi:hypothetical protein
MRTNPFATASGSRDPPALSRQQTRRSAFGASRQIYLDQAAKTGTFTR